MKKVILKFLLSITAILITLSSCSIINNDTYYPFKTDADGKWGMINTKGEVLFDAEFKEIPSVAKNGLFFVKNSKGLYELYTATEKPELIGENYVTAASFNNEKVTVVAREDEPVSIINTDGEVITVIEKIGGIDVERVSGFKNGVAIFNGLNNNNESVSGLIDKNGEVVLDPKYYAMSIISADEGLVFAIPDKYRNNPEKAEIVVYNLDGEEQFTLKCEKYENFGFSSDRLCINGYIPVKIEERGWGLLNKKGEEVLKPTSKIDRIVDMRDDVFIYKHDGSYGLMNVKGEKVLSAKYEALRFASDRLLWADKTGDEGYSLINFDGKEISAKSGKYTNTSLFENGCALVKTGKNEWGVVKDNAEEVTIQTEIYDVQLENNYSYNYAENDFFDIAKILDVCKLSKTGIGDFKYGIGAKALVEAYIKNTPTESHDGVTPDNWHKDRLTYTKYFKGVEVSVGLYYSAYLTETSYGSSYDYYSPSYSWTSAEPQYINAEISGSKINEAKQKRIFDAILENAKSIGSVFAKKMRAVIISVSNDRGLLITRNNSSIQLIMINNSSYKEINIDSYDDDSYDDAYSDIDSCAVAPADSLATYDY